MTKQQEAKLANQFLAEFDGPATTAKSLSEFVDGGTTIYSVDQLNNMMPDVVAAISGTSIGIELTAYSRNDLNGPGRNEDQLYDVVCRVSEIVQETIHQGFSDLQGLRIAYSPIEGSFIKKRQVDEFAVQLLEFLRDENQRAPIQRGERRHLPSRQAPVNAGFFGQWNLLQQHVASVTAYAVNGLSGYPVAVDVPGLTRALGTSVDFIGQTIRRKDGALANAFRQNIDEVWLLIHAARDPFSSAMAPLDSDRINSLLKSPAAGCAQQSGFARVFFWDGYHGGYVDLRTGDCCAYSLSEDAEE